MSIAESGFFVKRAAILKSSGKGLSPSRLFQYYSLQFSYASTGHFHFRLAFAQPAEGFLFQNLFGVFVLKSDS